MRVLAATLFLVLALPIGAREIELPRESERWLTLRAGELQIISNTSPKQTTQIARDLLLMREAVGQFTKWNVRSSKPTRVFFFRTERQFVPWRDAVLQRETDYAGVHIGTTLGDFILVHSDNITGLRVVYHELMHSIVKNTTPNLPLWLEEGLAEYYSTFQTMAGQAWIGLPARQHATLLKREGPMPLEDLLTMNQPAHQHDSDLFYAQSWALVHYLMENGQLAAVLEGKRLPDDLHLERKVLTHALRVSEGPRRNTKFDVAKLNVPPLPEPSPLPYDALLFELGQLLLASSEANAELAERFMREALRVNPAHAGAHAALGHCARAIELGSRDPEIYLACAAGAFAQDPMKARAYYTKATELAPGSARAWAGLGATYISGDEDPAPGLAALERARALTPGDPDVALYLTQLRLRTDERAAIETEENVFAEIRAAVERLNSGEIDEALRILDRLIPQIADPEILEETKKLRAQIAKRR